MRGERFQSTGKTSFYGDYLYDRIIPQDHFLRKLRDVVPWQRFTYKLVKYYRGKAQVGRPPIDPSVVLRMLSLAYLYNVSECQAERFCRENLPAKHFLGLAINAPVPDHSTLIVFKNRILENGKLRAYTKLFKDIISLARESGVEFGSLQILDSTHTVPDVNVEKDGRRKKGGQPLRDPNARWGVKRTRIVRDEKGQKKKVPECFYGYKAHVSFKRGSDDRQRDRFAWSEARRPLPPLRDRVRSGSRAGYRHLHCGPGL